MPAAWPNFSFQKTAGRTPRSADRSPAGLVPLKAGLNGSGNHNE